MVPNGYPHSKTFPFSWEKVTSLLRMIRDTLYDRKFQPLYIDDIVKENAELTDKYHRYEKEKEEFDAIKNKFYLDNMTCLELLEEKKAMTDEKQRLKRIHIKLELDRQNLNVEKERFEKEKYIIKGDILNSSIIVRTV